MKTVQLALRDSKQAQLLRDVLIEDGAHQVHVVEQPDVGMAGVIVMDVECLEAYNAPITSRERLVVVASKTNADLSAIWEAGVRRVVFEGDDARTMQLAILATELALIVDEP